MTHQHTKQTANIYSTSKHYREQYFLLKLLIFSTTIRKKFIVVIQDNGNVWKVSKLRLAKLC